MQDEVQIAARKIARGIAERLPGASIPKHDRAAAVFALGNGPFKGAIIEGMVLDMHGKTLVFGIETLAPVSPPSF